jgi:hypothetical protein
MKIMEFEELAQPLKELEDYEIKANNEEILAWFRKVRAACLDTASLHAIILELQEILKKNDIDLYDEKSPYYNILLAYVRDFFGNTDAAIANVDSSVLGFKKLGKEKDWHQAISNWFYGLLLCKQGQFDRAKAKIDDAIKIILKLYKEQYHFGQYSNEYKDMIETIKVSAANMRDQSQSRLAHNSLQGSESKDSGTDQKNKSVLDRLKGVLTSNPSLTQKASDINSSGPQNTPIKNSGAQKNNQPKGKNSSSDGTPPKGPETKLLSGNNNSHLRHIIIPVDMRAIENLDTNSTPLEPKWFDKLQAYEEKKAHHDGMEPQSELEQNGTQPKRIVIPSFPNYGQATAGPAGKAYLPDHSQVEKADAIDETFQIKFEGKEHKVNFINSQSNRTFVEGKNYGWLKVTGESMNNASPIPINDKDHVLFCESHDLESCAGKIVVAILSDSETQPPQLVIKYLLKLISPLPLRTDGWNEYSKFMLHSESSLDKDPKTGMSYKNDIEIDKDYQIVGEVLAVAKPIKLLN